MRTIWALHLSICRNGEMVFHDGFASWLCPAAAIISCLEVDPPIGACLKHNAFSTLFD